MSANHGKNSTGCENEERLNYGSGGIRGLFGKFPITLKAVVALGQAVGSLLKNVHKASGNNVLLLYDTRESSESLKDALAFGLSLQRTKVFDAGVLPTPAASVLLNLFHECSLAVVISASHNTFEYNGIKIFTREGYLTELQIDLLNQYFSFFYQSHPVKLFAAVKCYDVIAQAHAFYVKHVMQYFLYADFSDWDLVVLDCANGVASFVAPNIFAKLGIKYAVINSLPDGKNINDDAGSTHPHAISRAVVNSNAAIGFSFDGDADRVIACDFRGQVRDGDDILYVLSQAAICKQYPTVVGTVMSNTGLEHVFRQEGRMFVRADVGEHSLYNVLHEREDVVLAGEPSGHILCNGFLASSDGIAVALSVLKQLQLTKKLGFSTFTRFYSELISIALPAPIDLQAPAIAETVDVSQKELGNGRIFLRCSQTEPILRVLIEADNSVIGKQVSKVLTNKLAKIINQLR